MITEKPVYKNGAVIYWEIKGEANGSVVKQRITAQQVEQAKIDMFALTRRKINQLLFGTDCSCRNHPFDY